MSRARTISIDRHTLEKQERASNPAASAWVSANAGAGKTHVLSQRVIRLLLDGADPSQILCLTYTKTAAAEMENRVFDRLAAWTALDDGALAEAIGSMSGGKSGRASVKAARTLFASALESPGGLKIQTIHAFCTALLKRFPLEANIAGHFELLDDETSSFLREEAKRAVMADARHGKDNRLTDALDRALDAGGESGVDALFEAALAGKDSSAIARFLKALAAGRVSDADLSYCAGLKPGDTRASVLQDGWPLKALPPADLRAIAAAAASAKLATLRQFGMTIEAVLAAPDAEARFAQLQTLFLKADGGARKPGPFAKEPVLSAVTDFDLKFDLAAGEVLETLDRLGRLAMLEASGAAHALMEAAQRHYRQLKRLQGKLDYEDLIESARNLLGRDAASAWVQYKLDQGISHVLVDEAQDTSPRQWDLINALTGDFFSGEGAAQRNRTLFVVGDEKQSIYSFQGAQPDVFASTGRQKQKAAREADKPFEPVSLPLSFRSVPEILKAADLVFGPLSEQFGFAGGEAVVHEALRKGEHGRVEVWERLCRDKGDAVQAQIEDDWKLAVDHLDAPAVLLAREIAADIARTVGSQANPATGAPVRPGNILVLVRKRGPFVDALARELKDRKVPVAGADRLVLTSHIAVLDLMALARITLNPHDDLSLASLLKSPVFGLSDDDLIVLCGGRGDNAPLLSRLQQMADADPRCKSAAEQLARWRAEADFAPAHEFFARVLGRDGVRAKLIGRLGGEAADVLDEFLSFALAAETAGIHGLQNFIETLAASAPEIKREPSAGRDEVRIMTVHGAKGLEAPYVYLVDPGSAPAPSQHVPALFSVPLGADLDAFFWSPSGEAGDNGVKDAFKTRALAASEAEYRRLLYVGMTRAEDVLIVCGYGGDPARLKEGAWLDLVQTALEGAPETVAQSHALTGRPQLTFRLGETTLGPEQGGVAAARHDLALPRFLLTPAPMPELPPRPLTPSGAGLAIEDAPEPGTLSPVLDGNGLDVQAAMMRGAAVHKLLEVLPGLEPEGRAEAGRRYLERKFDGTGMDTGRLLRQALAIMNDERFSPLFATGAQAEASVGGTVEIGGRKRLVSGKIDRLAVDGGRVLIADFKTNRMTPRTAAACPPSHVAQLALYAALLRPLFPGHHVEAVLIYTEGPQLIALDDTMLDSALEGLAAS